MRVSFVVLSTLAALLVGTSADPAAAEAVTKTKFTITSPDSNDTMDGVVVQNGGDKYLILHLEEDSEKASEKHSTEDNDDKYSASDEKEERAGGAVTTVIATKGKKAWNKLDKVRNDILWRFFHSLVPNRFRSV